MYEAFHEAIVNAQVRRLQDRVITDEWADTSVLQRDAVVYVTIHATAPKAYEYRARIDMKKYPVDPYWVGFIDPTLPIEQWDSASDTDARYWPWSPMPGLHGSFILAFHGPYRTFWCRECTFPFFVYHGERRWNPGAWPVDRVVAYLREAIGQAAAPSRWRPMQQPALLQAAANAHISLPPDAGLGAR
jgi:hypothetical protein